MTDIRARRAAAATDDDALSTLAGLVVRIRDGDDATAWAELTQRYSRLLWGIARSHDLYGTDAEDIVQTVWLRLVEHIDHIDDPARVGAWLAAVTRRECLQALRRRHRGLTTVPLTGCHAEADTTADPAGVTAERDHLRQVAAAFHALPDRCRRLLRVLAAGSFGYAEAAAALGMPVGSVGPTRSRCLAALDRLIGQAG